MAWPLVSRQEYCLRHYQLNIGKASIFTSILGYHEAGTESVIFAPLIEDLVDLADLVDLVDLVGLVDLADQADQADLARFQIAITVQYVS